MHKHTVKNFISNRYGDDLITISDSADMHSLNKALGDDKSFDKILTDFILLSHLSLLKTKMININHYNQMSIEKILYLKLKLGKLLIEDI